MIKKETTARAIRTLTVPPLTALLLLLTLFFTRDGIYSRTRDLFSSVLFLSVIPILAYPFSTVLPGYKEMGRYGQRRLAFIMNFVGITASVVYGTVSNVSKSLHLIYLTYFLSVVMLIVFNQFLKVRASGHACSVTAPLVLLVHFIGGQYFLPCAALITLVVWASLVLKSHTPDELATGWISASIAFAISLLFVSI